MDMIYEELLKHCIDVDENGNFDMFLGPKLPNNFWDSGWIWYIDASRQKDLNRAMPMNFNHHNRRLSYRWKRYQNFRSGYMPVRLSGLSPKAFPLSTAVLIDKFFFLQEGCLADPMRRQILETLLRGCTLELPDIGALEVTELASRLFEGLGPHLCFDPYQHVRQIVVPWTMTTFRWYGGCCDVSTILSFGAIEEKLEKIVRHDPKDMLKIKILVNMFIDWALPPTQNMVQRLKKRGIHVQWEFQEPERWREVTVDGVSPSFTLSYSPRHKAFMESREGTLDQ